MEFIRCCYSESLNEFGRQEIFFTRVFNTCKRFLPTLLVISLPASSFPLTPRPQPRKTLFPVSVLMLRALRMLQHHRVGDARLLRLRFVEPRTVGSGRPADEGAGLAEARRPPPSPQTAQVAARPRSERTSARRRQGRPGPREPAARARGGRGWVWPQVGLPPAGRAGPQSAEEAARPRPGASGQARAETLPDASGPRAGDHGPRRGSLPRDALSFVCSTLEPSSGREYL